MHSNILTQVGTCMPVDNCMYEKSGSLNLMGVEVQDYEWNGHMSLCNERVERYQDTWYL